jgi:hypothetical protein
LQRYDDLPDEPFVNQPVKEPKIHVNEKRSFTHEINASRAAAISPNAPTTILTDEQLKECGNAYINNGIVRGSIDRSVFFIQGDRTRAIVEANDELIEVSTDEEAEELEQKIADDTLTIGGEELEDGNTLGGQPARIKELKRKIVRLNKRVKLHENIDKFLNSCLVFGRGALEIVRLPAAADWPIYGEPVALKHLASRKISQVYFNDNTGIFQGIDYDTGKEQNPIKFIPAKDLIIGFHDDNNIYANTQGSGLSAVWPILSVSQADDVINDEDIPEITKNTGGVFTSIYGGTNNDAKLQEIAEKVNGKNQLVHGLEGLDVKSFPLGRDPMELPNVRTANSKYICQGLNLPLFLMFEDTANFATANQTMQVYKAGILKRYRTWLQGILEDYWYDTILADHLAIDIKDVISAPIKIKAIFADINFEIRSEIVTADKVLFDMKVLNRQDIAKDIDRKDIVARLDEEEAEQDDIDTQVDQKVNQQIGLQLIQQQKEEQQKQLQQQQFQKQQASAAASTKAIEDIKLQAAQIDLENRIKISKTLDAMTPDGE